MLFESYIELIQQNKYIYSFSILISFFILSKLIVWVSEGLILTLTKKTKTEVDDLIVRKTNRPLSLIFLLLGFRFGLLPLEIKDNILSMAQHTISSLITIIGTYIVIVISEIIIKDWGRKAAEHTKSRFDDELVPIAGKASRVVVSLIGLLLILHLWGLQIGPLLTSLGIASIAIAFALQTTLGNIFGGMSIILDKSVKVGDKIKLDDQTLGTVMDVGLRSTKIKTLDNELVTVPNGKLAESKILNYQKPDPTVRISVPFGVEYGTSASKVRKTVIDAIKKMPKVLKEPEPEVHFMEMADSALVFHALFYVANFDDKINVRSEAVEEIYNALNKSKIVIPFPARTVYLKKRK